MTYLVSSCSSLQDFAAGRDKTKNICQLLLKRRVDATSTKKERAKPDWMQLIYVRKQIECVFFALALEGLYGDEELIKKLKN